VRVASGEGHERVVELLLNQGADVNTQDGYYGSALYVASRKIMSGSWSCC
jgi:hypothetical protein